MIPALACLVAAGGVAALPQVAVGRVDTDRPVVALTFDACATNTQPNAFDRRVFDILKSEQIPATIFMSGRWIESHPDVAREVAADPLFELGNHSYSHPILTGVDPARLADEIARTEDLISQLGRRSVAFRPPAGVWSARVLKMAAERRLPMVLWDVVSGDAGGHVKFETMVQGVTRSARPGSIIIFHINGRGPYTKDALLPIIQILRARGLQFVTLSQLMALPGGRAQPARKVLVRKIKERAHTTG